MVNFNKCSVCCLKGGHSAVVGWSVFCMSFKWDVFNISFYLIPPWITKRGVLNLPLIMDSCVPPLVLSLFFLIYLEPVLSVQFSCSVVSDSLWPHELQHARQASLSITSSQNLPRLMSIESVMPSNHLILPHPLLLLPPIPPSIRVFSIESALHIRWPEYWSFSFKISPSNEHPGLISSRMDWLGLLAVQVLKSLLQHHSSKASILLCWAFFIVQLSHPYMTTGKTIALTRQTFVGKVMSLLFHMLSRFIITFLPRSKGLLISRLQSPSAVILEPRKIKSDTVSTVSPSICHEVIGLDAMILVFWMLSLKPTFPLSSFTFIKRLFSSLLSATRVVSSAYHMLSDMFKFKIGPFNTLKFLPFIASVGFCLKVYFIW